MFKHLPIALSKSFFYKIHTRQIITEQNNIQTIRGYLLGRRSNHKIKTLSKHVLRHTYRIRAKLFSKVGYIPIPEQRAAIIELKTKGMSFSIHSSYDIKKLKRKGNYHDAK